MSLTSALSNAVSGLSVSSRAAELIAANVANAQTEGYGRRELILSSNVVGGKSLGVRVDGIERVVDPVAIRERRLAQADLGFNQTLFDFRESFQQILSTPDDPRSLPARLSALNAALVQASASPSDPGLVGQVVAAAKSLATSVSSTAQAVQTLRQDADNSIASQVAQLNQALSAVDDLNQAIAQQLSIGGEAAGLMDQRQLLIDTVSSIVPVTAIPRDHGRIELHSKSGAILVGSSAAHIEFSPSKTITPAMSIDSGALSGLSLTGAAASPGDAFKALAGGSLEATFRIRDELAPAASDHLDQLAQDLINRTADQNDPSIAGLFSEKGEALIGTLAPGLAQNLSVNSLHDPAAGGQPLALQTLNSGDPTVFVELKEALNVQTALPSDAAHKTAFDHLNDFTSAAAFEKYSQETILVRANSLFASLEAAELSTGVDTDTEMQKLLLVENAYAANAKLIQAIDEMLQSLLRI